MSDKATLVIFVFAVIAGLMVVNWLNNVYPNSIPVGTIL
jgi:hypothetical protein